MIWKVFVSTLCISVVVIILISVAMFSEDSLTLELKRFYFNAYKSVGIGLLVALLAVIIPQMLPEARDQFERFKDSRIAYSHAKTSVIYLPARLATLSFEDAVSHVQDAHEKLHLAETYKKELLTHLMWYPKPEIWSERMYWEISAIRAILESNVDTWSNLSKGIRMRVLSDAVDVVRKEYDEDGRQRSKENRESRIQIYVDSLSKRQGEQE